MRKTTIVLLAALVMALPMVFGGVVINATPGNGTTTPVAADPEMTDWFTFFPVENCSPNYNPFCTQTYSTRNSISGMQEYEFAFTGDVLHFEMTVRHPTTNALIIGYGGVDLLCDGAGLIPDISLMNPCSGTSPVYDTATGKYVRKFCGDYTIDSSIMDDRCTIVPKFDIDGTGPGGWYDFAIFPSSTYPLYENVNEILYNPAIDGTAPLSYTWYLNQVNDYNEMTPYPAIFGFTSIDDSEGQGVIGKLYTRTLIFDCISASGMDINTDQVQYRVGAGTDTNLPANEVWALVEDMVSTSGTGFSRQFFYQVWWSAGNSCSAFSANSGMPQAAFATY
ncbi:hypothetical protein JW968_06405 [Candidatus Woesearchaeota archaeon]|nr:hypothetical protein [Candidatus Woesearchaeota archaeon]